MAESDQHSTPHGVAAERRNEFEDELTGRKHSAPPAVDPMKAREVTAAIILIERRADVRVPAGVLATLVSYALAGPSNDASCKARDEAVAAANAAYLAEYERLRAAQDA